MQSLIRLGQPPTLATVGASRTLQNALVQQQAYTSIETGVCVIALI